MSSPAAQPVSRQRSVDFFKVGKLYIYIGNRVKLGWCVAPTLVENTRYFRLKKGQIVLVLASNNSSIKLLSGNIIFYLRHPAYGHPAYNDDLIGNFCAMTHNKIIATKKNKEKE